MLSIPLTRYVLTAAIRDRLIPVLLLVMIVGTCVSVFLGSAAIIEANKFAMVFTAGSVRFIGVLGLVLFVVFFVRRSFENKDVEYLLSRPISRVSFILSHALAFSLLAVVMAVVATFAVATLMPHFHLTSGGFLWVSLLVEFVIMVNAALFFSMVLPSATTGVLATLGLYVLARMMGELLGIIYEAGAGGHHACPGRRHAGHFADHPAARPDGADIMAGLRQPGYPSRLRPATSRRLRPSPPRRHPDRPFAQAVLM